MIRILVVVNIRPYRDGLVQLLNAREESIVVGAEAIGRDAVERLDETAPDVALVDRGIPDLDELSIALAQRSPRIPLVIVGIADSESDVLACAEMGISGYITPGSSIDELVSTVQSVADGELICSPRTAGVLMRRLAELANGSCRKTSRAVAFWPMAECAAGSL
jgi:two-component system nitrate/nitrite response regulator NarL